MPRFEEEIRRLLSSDSIDVVGINATSPTRRIALNIARTVRQVSPQTKIVIGGPHASIVGRPFISRYSNIIDALVTGEGEDAFPQLLAAYGNNEINPESIPGIILGEGKELSPRLIKDLDAYPIPTYIGYRSEACGDLFDTLPVMTSRGCPYRCSFCYSRAFWSGRFRCRNVKRVVDEVEYGISGLGLKKVHFNDDVFSYPLDRAKAILTEMLRRGLRLQLYCTTRMDCLDEEFLRLFEAVGGGCIYFGIETGSERLRKLMGKMYTNEKILDSMALLRRHPAITVGFFLMFGYPTETAEDISETENLLRRARPDEVTCNLAHIHPGTHLYEVASQEGKCSFESWINEEPSFFPYESCPIKLQRLYDLCRKMETRFGVPRHRSVLIRDLGSSRGEKADVTKPPEEIRANDCLGGVNSQDPTRKPLLTPCGGANEDPPQDTVEWSMG